jgi:hypothetical protein
MAVDGPEQEQDIAVVRAQVIAWLQDLWKRAIQEKRAANKIAAQRAFAARDAATLRTRMLLKMRFGRGYEE